MLDIEKILVSLGIEYRSAGPDNVVAFCLNPAHPEKKPSMNIHKETGIINCFGCELTGNIFTLLSYKGISGGDAILYLRKFPSHGYTKDDLSKVLEDYVSNRDDNSNNAKDESGSANVVLPAHRRIDSNWYLEKRGVTPEDMSKWQMGVVTDEKNYPMNYGWILVPIYQHGKLCNFFMRNPYGDGKLYGKYSRKSLLPGIDFCKDYDRVICVSEGIFDAISISHVGFQSVACLSNKLLKPQLEILKKFKEIAIVPDNDSMGARLVDSASSLEHNCNVFVFPLPPDKKDAGECNASDILKASMRKLLWSRYLIGKKYA